MKKGQLIDIDYNIENEKSVIYLAIRNENGEKEVIKEEFLPYFFVREKDLALVEEFANKISTKITVENSEFRSYDNFPVKKIIFYNPKELKKLRDILEKNNIETLESDIRLIYRYLIDKNIKHFVQYDNKAYSLNFEDYFPLVVSVLDIETVKDNIILASLITKKYAYTNKSRIILAKTTDTILVKNEMISEKEINKEFENKNINLIVVNDEKELILKLLDVINYRNPDILSGWNLIDFDINFLKKKAEKYKIKLKLGMEIGNEKRELDIKVYEDYMKTSEANVFGTVILDGISILESSFIKLEEYSLDYVAKELLNENKVYLGNNDKMKNIENSYYHDPITLINYNVQDCELVLKIFEKYDLIELQIERVKNTGLPLKKVFSSVVALDSLYLRKAKERKIVLNNSKYNVKENPISGGFVRDPIPGIYEFVNVYDFKSLYPSIIRTFNIDPLEFEKGDIIAPNGAKFGRNKGILPEIIDELFKNRELAIANGKKLESQAIKIIMNSFYGVLANPSCRFFNPKIADAITSFGRLIIKTAAEYQNNKNYEIIYGDTDSIFVKTNAKNYNDAVEIGKKEEKEINDFFKDWCQENYKVESKLTIEYEKTYVKLLLPESRTGGSAKKRYAGVIINKNNEQEIELTGLEGVRSDWTDLAKEFQLNLLKKLFNNENLEEYIKQVVEDLKNGKYDDKLIYRKSLRKDLDEYTKTTPPHVKAARMLENIETPIVKYVMTLNGPLPLEKLNNSTIDYSHYIEKQIKPIANQILIFFNKDFDSIFKGKQKSIFDFKK
ncbi:MAG: DNA polymerase II [Candidatus Woesearchaeota archaeon]